MAAKLWWRFRNNSCLWAHYMMAKYSSKCHPTICKLKPQDSRIWKYMLIGSTWVEQKFFWGINQGKVSFYYDNWTGKFTVSKLLNICPLKDIYICNLWKDGHWDLSILPSFIPQSIINQLNKLVILHGTNDQIIFMDSNDGNLHSSSLWKDIFSSEQGPNLSIFHSKALNKSIFMFIWRLYYEFISTDCWMVDHGLSIASICLFCRANSESIEHLFFQCNFSKKVWAHFSDYIDMGKIEYSSKNDFFNYWSQDGMNKYKNQIKIIAPAIILYKLWTFRNNIKYKQVEPNFHSLISQIYASIMLKIRSIDSTHSESQCCNSFYKSSYLIKKDSVEIYCWQKPHSNAYKINLDATCNSSFALIGGVIRNSEGKLVIAYSFKARASTLLYATLLSLNVAIKAANFFKLENIAIDCCNRTVFNIIMRRSGCPASAYSLFQHYTRATLNLNLSIFFVPSRVNMVAHSLIDCHCRSKFYYHWIELPRYCRGYLLLDFRDVPYLP